MTENCETVRTLLGLGEVLPAGARDHLGKCIPCRGLRAQFEDLDEILTSEPAPAAPLQLASAVMAAVIELRAAELRQLRLQLLIPLAAAALLALVAAFGLPLDIPETQIWVPDPMGALDSIRGFVDGFSREVEVGISSILDVLPSPPVLLVGLLAPCLMLFNWSLCRGRPQGAAALL